MENKSKKQLKVNRKLNKLKSGLILSTSLVMLVPSSPIPVLATEVLEDKENENTTPAEETALSIKEKNTEEAVTEIGESQEEAGVPKEETEKLTEKKTVKDSGNSTIIPESAWEGANWLTTLAAEKVGKPANELTYEDLTTITSLNYTSPANTYVRLPGIIGSFSNLTTLKVSGLEGAIPAELANISTLSELTLNKGRLTGIIPSQIQRMESLTQIDFSDNALSGNYDNMDAIFQSKVTSASLANNFLDNTDGQQSISFKSGNEIESIDLNKETVILNSDGSENVEKKTRVNNNLQYATSNGSVISGERGNYTLAVKNEEAFTLNIGIERASSGQAFFSTEITPDIKPKIVVGKKTAPEFQGVPTPEEIIAAFEVRAYDNKDGDITSQITVSGLDNIDGSVSGSYNVELTATDSDGNTSDTQTITVAVVAEDTIPFELWQVTVNENGAITGGAGSNFSKEALKQVNAGTGVDKTISQLTPADVDDITSIRFSGNTYSSGGAIPKAVGEFKNLESLTITSLGHGDIPNEMKGLTKLKTLSINGSTNQSGSDLSDPNNVIETLTGLQNLTVAETTGKFDITKYPTNLTNLKSLKFQNTGGWQYPIKVTGNTSGFESFTELTDLELTGNLTGLTIDDHFNEMPAIKNLKISSEEPSSSKTNFKGEITSDITRLTTLTTLTLNGLSEYASGTLPAYFGEIPNLTSLNLAGNGFVGEIPASYDHLSTLNLNKNYLTGDYDALNKSSTRTFYGNLYDNAPASANQSEILVTRNSVSNNNWILGEPADYTVSFAGVEKDYHQKYMKSMYQVESMDANTNATITGTNTVKINPLATGDSDFKVSIINSPETLETNTMSQKIIQGTVVDSLPEIHYDANKLNIALQKGTTAPTVSELMEQMGITSTMGDEDVSQYTEVSGVTEFSDMDMTATNTSGYEFTLTATTASGVEGSSVKVRVFITDTNPETVIPVSSWEEQQPLIDKVTSYTGKSIEEVTYQDIVNLTTLDLSNSGMTKFPAVFGEFLSLTNLNISNNYDLVGTIPDSIGNLKALQIFKIYNTAISGQIPDSVLALTKLKEAHIDNTFINDKTSNFSSVFNNAINQYNDDYYEKSFLIGSSSSWKLQAGTTKSFNIGEEVDLFADDVVEANFSGTLLGESATRTKFSKYMNIEILQGNAQVVKDADGLQKIHTNGEGSITARVTVPNADVASLLSENANTTLIVNFNVKDANAPVITTARESVEVTTGSNLLTTNNFISLFGISVYDEADGNLTYAANTTYIPEFINELGEYRVVIDTIDYSGNEASKTVELLDKSKPVIGAAISSQNVSLENASSTLSDAEIIELFGVTAKDNMDSNIADSLTVSGEENYNGAVGTYQFTVTARDESGNESSRALVLNVTDEGTPEINVDASKLTYELGGEPLSETSTPEEFTAYIGLTMTDNVSSEETLRANLIVDGFDEIDFTTAGEYPITLSTSDESGNEANLDVNFTIEDTVVPVLGVDNQRISQSFGEDYAFTSESLVEAAGININDADAKASYTIDEADLEALNTAIQSNDLTNAGEYSVEVTAKDSSGNVSIPVTVVVNVQDTEAPVLEADLSHSLVQYTTLPTADEIKESIHATVTDKVDKELSVADIQVTDLDSINMEVAGTSTIKLSVVDGSGNESERTVEIEVQADTDKDGIPDSDEKDEGTDPLNPDNDPDGDDVPDGDDKDGNGKPDGDDKNPLNPEDNPNGGDNTPLNPENNPNTQGDQANTSGANKEPSTKTTQIELPATGDDTSATTTLFGGIMALLGTIWIKRRSKKEKTVTTKK